jgi:ATP synthase in type III secretion protein N
MPSGRVINGEVFDATVQASRIIADAQKASDQLIADAQQRADLLVTNAAIAAAKWQITELQRTPAPLPLPRQQESERSIDLISAPADGTVSSVVGLTISAHIKDAYIGEQVWLECVGNRLISAEIVGLRQQEVILMPLASTAGLTLSSRVWRSGTVASVTVSETLLGRVVDGLGRPIDGGEPLVGESVPVVRPAPMPLARPRISKPFVTGVRAIDGALTLGQGQRVGLFAAAGVGKSVLLSQIAQQARADVVVICQVGERGREVREILDGALANQRHRTVAVCATSDAAPLERVRAVQTATAIAEWFRDQQQSNVLLLVDSLTRVARAQREVGLSAGEPVARHGYPPSVFALLPKIVERAGNAARGSITGLYTVLVAGDDLDEPIADEVRGLLDGHIVLDRSMVERGEFPPIDIVRSSSRLANVVTDEATVVAAHRLRGRCAVLEAHRDLITLGAYKPGQHAGLDEAMKLAATDTGFLRQGRDEYSEFSLTIAELAGLATGKLR